MFRTDGTLTEKLSKCPAGCCSAHLSLRGPSCASCPQNLHQIPSRSPRNLGADLTRASLRLNGCGDTDSRNRDEVHSIVNQEGSISTGPMILSDHRDTSGRVRSGFTIVELLVVIAVIGVLTGLLLPALNLARESSRNTTCQSNLRQFGMGLAVHAQQKKGYFCTGALDWQRDGAVTEVGWVADLVQLSIPVGKMLCPSNPAQVSETFNDLLSLDATHLDRCVDRLGTPPQTLPDGTKTVNPCYQIVTAAMDPDSEERRVLVQEKILNEYYNTNYTASWILVRSAPPT